MPAALKTADIIIVSVQFNNISFIPYLFRLLSPAIRRCSCSLHAVLQLLLLLLVSVTLVSPFLLLLVVYCDTLLMLLTTAVTGGILLFHTTAVTAGIPVTIVSYDCCCCWYTCYRLF